MILCASSVKENSLCTINQMVCKKIFLKIFLKILSNDKYRRMESEEHTMEQGFICKIPTIEEMNRKWDYEISRNEDNRENWVIWKRHALENFMEGHTLPYYGLLNGEIICEATAMLNPDKVQNSDGLVDSSTAYLAAFRTIPEYQGKGYYSKLFHYMLRDLKKRGYVRITLGVEPDELENKQIYKHFGFDEFIKKAQETYPDGTTIDVEYYGKRL